MILSKNDDNLNDIIEELYLLTTLKYHDLMDYTYNLKNIYDDTNDFDKLFEPLNNPESDFNTAFESFLNYFDNDKDYKDCFKSVFDKVTTFMIHFSEFEDNEKIKTIRKNIKKKYGN